MSIHYILTPDEQEFFEYLKNNHLSYFKDYISIKDYQIDFIGMFADTREFVVGFSQGDQFMHELSDVILSFKVTHNHGNFLVHGIKTNHINQLDLDKHHFFMVEKNFQYEEEIL